jgi:hypothetical protein
MRARTALLLAILVALGIFAALNWTAVMTPASLNLVLARVEAPLGVVLLAVTAGVTVLYAIFLTWTETSALLETRRFSRELQAQRQLADSAEASRFTELKAHLQGEIAALRASSESAKREVIAKVDSVEDHLRADVERAGNTLTAYFAELEDRLNRGDRPAPPRSSP